MKLDLFISTIGPMRVRKNERLHYHTFSKSGGEAEVFFMATSQAELIEVLDLAHDLKIPFFIIGGGTKVVLSSQVKGLVIKNKATGIKMAGLKGKFSKDGLGIEEAYVEADSGVTLDNLNKFAMDQRLQEIAGVNSLNSSVGGSIYLDPLIRAATQTVKIWDEGEVYGIKLENLKNRHVVLSVIFKFTTRAI